MNPSPSPATRHARGAGTAVAVALIAPAALDPSATSPAAAEAPPQSSILDGESCSPRLAILTETDAWTLAATGAGTITSQGAHLPGYGAGDYGPDDVRRNYASFDLSSVSLGSGEIEVAAIEVPAHPGCTGQGGPGIFRTYEVSTPVAELEDHGSIDVARFEDLGDGDLHGSLVVTDPEHPYVYLELSPAAVRDIEDASGTWAIGGTWQEATVSLSGVASSTEEPGHHGWYHTPVSVSFECESTLPLAEPGCPAPVEVTRNGSTSVSRTIADTLGIHDQATVEVKIDRRAPRLRLASKPRWETFGRAPGLRCISSDEHSGLAVRCAKHTRQLGVRADGRRVIRFAVKATDVAGNTKARVGRYLLR